VADARKNANPGDNELTDSDRALLEGAAQEKRDADDADANSLAADDAVRLDVGTQPASTTSSQSLESDGYEENVDGLDPTEAAVRQQAEDHATGDGEDYTG
jgi:hypothetical protein